MHRPSVWARAEHRPAWPNRSAAELAISRCWHVENRQVLQLDGDSPEGRALSACLASLGLEVHHGPHHPGLGTHPVLIVHARNRLGEMVRARIDMARSAFPEAPLCIATNRVLFPEFRFCPEAPVFDDARALMQAVSLPFLSGLGD